MTVKEVKDKLAALKPHAYSDDEVMAWLSRVEGRIFLEVVKTHENPALITYSGYSALTPDETVLIAPEPYDELYLFYLMAQVDLHNQEYLKYNNSVLQFNTAYQAFANYWHRTFLPIQPITHFNFRAPITDDLNMF